MPRSVARIVAAFWTRARVRPDLRCMAVVAIALAVLLAVQDLVALLNRPRG
jgi:hypothetical protein